MGMIVNQPTKARRWRRTRAGPVVYSPRQHGKLTVKAMRRILTLLALCAAASASADTLLLQGISIEAASADQRPRRGMSMENVEARYGAPASRIGAIGEPPISRWEYPGFIVYFEYNHVVHAAVRR